jgi:acyl-ACP thioesterase
MTFNYEYEIRYGDYKDFDTVKPAAVLDIAQDIAIRHSDFCGYGLHKMRELGKAWLIQGLKLRLEKPVQTLKNITVQTAIKGNRGATSERGCLMLQGGEVVAKTITNWFLADCNTQRPCRIPPEMMADYGTHDFEDPFFAYTKPELREAKKVYTVRVCNKELDTNRHLNNQKSAELLMDALPFEFAFTDMTVLYKKPAYLGDELEVCVAEIPNGYYVHLQTTDQEVCVAGTFERSEV